MEATTYGLIATLVLSPACFSCAMATEDVGEVPGVVMLDDMNTSEVTAAASDELDFHDGPRIDRQLICLALTASGQEGKEAFCGSRWRLDPDKKDVCSKKASSGSDVEWILYCALTIFPD
ncbi:hypothetical protein [Sorangium cellulosum]|uniref:hypothetical protein n=1 Tax=Sorangium cellulosum TaxID=56 RepID=UPI0012FF5B26|nr:hypothetical protein [Sorangium cellulosum]